MEPEALAEALREAGPPETPASFGRLVLDADGRLWVQRERPRPGVDRAELYGMPGAEHDVFDAAGRYLGTVRLPEGARLQTARGDTVYAFEIGDMGETWVVAYAMN